jgi:hypothetical protein
MNLQKAGVCWGGIVLCLLLLAVGLILSGNRKTSVNLHELDARLDGIEKTVDTLEHLIMSGGIGLRFDLQNEESIEQGMKADEIERRNESKTRY